MQNVNGFTKNVFNTKQVISISQDLVTKIAPEEISSFPALSDLYNKNPESFYKQQITKDDELGIGTSELIYALSPIIILIVQQVIVQISSDAAEKGAGTLFRRLKKKIFRHSSHKGSNQPGSPEYTLADIRNYAYKTACEFKIPKAKANQIADALAGRLATRQNDMEQI